MHHPPCRGEPATELTHQHSCGPVPCREGRVWGKTRVADQSERGWGARKGQGHLLSHIYCSNPQFWLLYTDGELYFKPYCVSDFPDGSDKRICLQWGRSGLDPWVRKISWRREWQPTPVFLPGEVHGPRSLAGYSPWGRRVWLVWDTFTIPDK